jgi:hypothetical protein
MSTDRPVKTKTPSQKLQAPLVPESERPLSPACAFVVQFRERVPGAADDFTGRVEHIVSGRTARFESSEELLAFFVRVLNAAQTRVSEQA